MPRDPRYNLNANDVLVDEFFTQDNHKALIDGINSAESTEKISADITKDGTTNKVFTSAEKSKLSGIETGAQVNVKPDWSKQESDPAGILNKVVYIGIDGGAPDAR